ncbi:MAG: DmsC/YnfH family molybdoenzyme membrane anchor subunit [Pseudomonadota bacterium]
MFKVRSDEPEYAFLRDRESKARNRYGTSIETVAVDDVRRDKSLAINNDAGIGDNPNRYKQHGFFLNADNCIGCHACEAACSEKNDNPAHIAFRSVGFVEGGAYPAYQRLNISMACNHCDNPVCLKGCPTRAYTKFAEYGAVLQDPDICFGCGYCTWVCPYNAPQLDPVKGQVTKCNMCVDRLEVGLKPACVSACLGNALDFGVIENIPRGRTQAKTEIPGFPRTDITHPNIRFQQTRSTHREMTRTDSTPLKYHRDDKAGKFKPAVDEKRGRERYWNWGILLRSHENAHAIFTLLAQAVMGAFVLLTAGSLFNIFPLQQIGKSAANLPLLGVMVLLMGFGLFKLNMHLGKPHRFYRGFYNLRHSPVSREIAGVSLFFGSLAGFALFSLFDGRIPQLLLIVFSVTGVLGAALGSWYMYRLYRIPARPFWDHSQTATAFYGSMLTLGSLLIGVVATAINGVDSALLQLLAVVGAAGVVVESSGHWLHARDLKQAGNEGAAAHYEQTTTFGKTYFLRNTLLAVNLLLLITLATTAASIPGLTAAALLPAALLLVAYTSRILFYAVVIPTTMPGAFFWKNRGFVEHARETGLAEMTQMGVVYEGHHRFRLDELLQTLRETSFKEKRAQFARIFTG